MNKLFSTISALAVASVTALFAPLSGAQEVKGDVVNLDWVPGRGWLATHNGRSLNEADGKQLAISDKLAYQIYMRMYIGEGAPTELRNGLLGLTKG